MSSAADTSKSATPIAEGQPDNPQTPVTSKAAVVAPAGRKRSRWKRFAKTSLVVIVLAAVIGGYFWKRWDTRSRDRLDRAIAAMHQAGYPARFHEIELRPIKPEENFAGLFTDAAALLPKTALIQDVHGDFRWKGEPHLHPRAKDVMTLEAPALAALRNALKRPRCQFPYDFRTEDPFGFVAFESHPVIFFADAIRLEGQTAIEAGEVPAAYQSVITALEMDRVFHEQPFHYYGCPRSYPMHIALNLLERCLAVDPPDPAVYETLDALLVELEATHRMSPVFASAACQLTAILDRVGSQDFLDRSLARVNYRDSQFMQNVQKGKVQLQVRLLATHLMAPKVRETQADLLETYLKLSELVDTPGADATREFTALVREMDRKSLEDNPLSIAFMDYEQLTRQTRMQALITRQRLNCARLALRACRFRQAQGQLPNTLQDLLDPSLTQLPVDLINDQPLVYVSSVKGFKIGSANSDYLYNTMLSQLISVDTRPEMVVRSKTPKQPVDGAAVETPQN